MDTHKASSTDLHYILNHVFFPPQLPQRSDGETQQNLGNSALGRLARLAYEAAEEFSQFLPANKQMQWASVVKMIKNLADPAQAFAKQDFVHNMLNLGDGDALALHIRAQNAGLIVRRIQDYVVFEAFEASPPPAKVMEIEGKLICSYPGPAVKIPLSVAQDCTFVQELASFLAHMDVDELDDAVAKTKKAGSTVHESRGTTDPKYITELLVVILHGIGEPADVQRITKRIADDVCWNDALNPWRRSPLWLIMRVAIQTTSESHEVYKAWMVFFHARLLNMFLDHDFSSDLLHTARVKTSRRACKLRDSAFPSLLEFVRDVVQKVQRRLEKRWLEEQRLQASSPPRMPNHSEIERDTVLTLLDSRKHLSEVMRPHVRSDTRPTFRPTHHPRLRDGDITTVYPDGLTNAVKVEPYVALADFEFLVRESLGDWTSKNIKNPLACSMLKSYLEQYIPAATTHYRSNPEDQSIMLLTILELWVALDRIVCSRIPLLLSYAPEIPASILEPTLVRHAVTTNRVTAVECYLRRRHSNIDSSASSIYSSEISHNTFAVRYFRESSHLQALKSSIEEDAANARESKCDELEGKNAKHAQLMERISVLDCEYSDMTDRWGDTTAQHSKKRCRKCKLEKQARSMRIDVHEWPLPKHAIEAEATVFELNCPLDFSIWRNLTYKILRDIGMPHIHIHPQTTYALKSYNGLKAWSKKQVWGRISFASKTKSFLHSHYRNIKIPAQVDSVCVNNGMTFKLYDTANGEMVHSSFSFNIDLHPFCTLQLPDKNDSPYKYLQYAVNGTTHTHNSTIVKQHYCPTNLSIHEQLAFSNLRCGPQLQWMNIARELRTRVLTFSSEEVHTLITQAAWQMGPLSDDEIVRVWHAELQNRDFGSMLLRECRDILSHVEGNWTELTTVKSIIYLISRLLSSAANAQVHVMGYAFLREARAVTYRWMREILQKLQDIVSSDKSIRLLQMRACEAAASCRATFDVDSGPHLNALLSSSEDVAVLVECAIVIHDNASHYVRESFPDFEKMLNRDRRLGHFLESIIADWICEDRNALDGAIISVWPGYQPGGNGWLRLSEPNSHWMTSTTNYLPDLNQLIQQVHYNILSGKLVIDGKSLGRLPKEIVDHPLYKRILGQVMLDVIPANMVGMDYATRFLVHDYQASAVSPTIRARERSGQIFEIIPHNIFATDFPFHFSYDHVHLMDVNTGKVEFRPLANRWWQRSSQDWHLNFSVNGPSFMSCQDRTNRKLVDYRSETFRLISLNLHPLEYSDYLIVTADLACQSKPLTIDLPRFKISFFLNEDGILESNNLQSMVIDNDQCMGTMIGLRSQLVLRHKEPNFASLPRSRIVLIPHGEVQYSLPLGANHVRIHINTRSQNQVVWYKYEMDTDLGTLVGNVNLTSHLFRIYLHALSSHPLPDPLTHQRGTDLALQELDSAGSFSFQQLTNTDVELLRLIGKISPKREYYPKGLRAMQTTTWSPLLPVLSQHGTFDTAVSKIMQYARSLTIFPELHSEEVEYTCCGDSLLMARAKRRCSIYCELPIESSSDCDKCYARGSSPNSPGAVNALKISQVVYTWPLGYAGKPTTSGLLEEFQRWGHMKGIQTDHTSLKYSKEWLSLDLSAKWFSLYEFCRHIEQPCMKFELIFSFAALAYGSTVCIERILELLAVATISQSLLDVPPCHSSYDLTRDFEPLRPKVQEMIRSKVYDFDDSPAALLARQEGERSKPFRKRLRQYYANTSNLKIDDTVDRVMRQWPTSNLRTPFDERNADNWFSTKDVHDVQEYFATCFRNSELKTFTSRVSRVFERYSTAPPSTGKTIQSLHFSSASKPAPTLSSSPALEYLMLDRSPPFLSYSLDRFGFKEIYEISTGDFNQPIDTTSLTRLVDQFEHNHNNDIDQLYSDRLQLSLQELHGQRKSTLSKDFSLPVALCITYRQICQSRLSDIFTAIRSALGPLTPAEKILEIAGMWPPLSQRNILQQLTSSARGTCLEEWTECLITFARAMIEYQHSQRLAAFSLRSDVDNFFKEVNTAWFNYSDARQNPDWLLIQIQGNFITRRIQSQVAREMISPSSERNIALQLNMGEGKSQVIVPLVAAAVANSQRLVRVVVLKPLARQMFQLLVERLSGFANRRIFYLPFSRDIKATPQAIKNIGNLFKECARVRGVLVAQPEHILSFRLMVIDRTLLSGGPDLSQAARDLQATQTWLNSTSRDILDESDELLHIRYQLIYTMGQQQPVDDGPDRWITTQQIFDLVCHHMQQLHQEFPEDVELAGLDETAEGQFPHFRLLGSAASQSLVSRIAEDALNGILENLTFVGLGSQPSLRTSVFHFVTVKDISPEIYHSVAEIYTTTGLWKGLLLLRGILAHGILVYVLSRRRYRVDFGLDAKRSLLAVPYRAKDVPSLRSEFGHPDVVICLTCLSYYYEGLTTTQVYESFELLNKLDNPSLEYETWARRGGADIPDAIRQLIGVNMKDVDTFTRNVIPYFRRNKSTIDFYLSQVVFPKEAKEFPNKLGTSGWDLAESKANFTTGFSGTNDNSDLLPTSITQTDPVNQLRTNAQVLEYLLRTENKRYVCSRGKNGGPSSAAELLEILVHEPEEIRVLLDVGAQMLEMTNQQLIEHWLSLISSQDIKAGIFFNDSDTLSVITRNGSVELLHSSPFFQRLDQCIVYLDDAHTRGTDLRLPRDFRALVTLGPKVTKDKLVQGCMRMRSLGHGQSVVFCAPPEVDRHIRKLEGVEPSASVHVADVLSWAMANTCSDIEDHVSHWVQQGVYYHKRREGSLAFIASQETDIGLLKTSWLEPAAQTLDEMYGITTARSSMMEMVEGIPAMQDRLKQLGLMEASGEAIDEEQEREVSHELEEEAQLERPPAIPAAKHRLDEEVRMFVRHGTLQPESKIFMPLLTPLRSASETLTPPNPWTKQLLCTRDFMTTTTSGNERTLLTEYLRPVHWIVSHIRQDGDMLLVVMSPYETNALLEDIRHSKHVRLHVYAPRTSESMKPFDLSFYCIPPLDDRPAGRTSLTNDIGYQLNIWAGQLYFDSYQAYLDICLLLGISSSESEANSLVESDRFVPPGGRPKKMSAVCLFDKSPLPLLKILFGLRRKGMSFQSTHMGKLLQARLLLPKHFDENA